MNEISLRFAATREQHFHPLDFREDLGVKDVVI